MNRIRKIRIDDFRAEHWQTTEPVRHIKYLPYLSVVQSTVGKYRVSVDNSPYVETAGNGVFVAPAYVKQDILHIQEQDVGYMYAHWVILDVAVNDNCRLEDMFKMPVLLPKQYNEEIAAIIDEVEYGSNFIKKERLLYRLIEIILSCSKSTAVSPYISVAPAIEYIDAHISEKIDVAVLSGTCNMSAPDFFRKFKKYFEMSPIQYINKRRICKAIYLLETTSQSVGEIAEACGVADLYYFSKMYKKYTGLSPLKYRTMFMGKS